LLCDGDYRKANLVDRIVTTRVAKTSNVSAPNCGSSSEVLAVKEMHDIGIDAVLLIYSTKFEVAR
jgi:hypothetical protein